MTYDPSPMVSKDYSNCSNQNAFHFCTDFILLNAMAYVTNLDSRLVTLKQIWGKIKANIVS